MFYFCVIFCDIYGRLIIITIATYGDDIAVARRVIHATLIVYLIKNNFDWCVKSCFWINFLCIRTQLLHTSLILLMQFIVIYKFLFHCDYLHDYQLYQNIELLGCNNRYNSYKNEIECLKPSNMDPKKIQRMIFCHCKRSITRKNFTLWCSMYVCMLIYF